MSSQDEYRIVLSSVASIYDNPSFSSELITQGLIWEELIVIDKKDNWYKVKQRDGYKGWIHSFYLTDSSIYDNNKLLQDYKNWYWVKDKFTILSLEDNSNFLISFGSAIPCFQDGSNFFTLLPNNNKVNINKNSLIRCIDKIKYVENISYCTKQLIGIPYLWGGKSSFGFDCSGLVQTVFKTNGVSMPRDSKDQYNLIKNNQVQLDKAKTGDLLFFKENDKICHVGIYDKDLKFIHCSGMVKYNSLDKEDVLFDKELIDKFAGIFSISEIIKEQLNERK